MVFKCKECGMILPFWDAMCWRCDGTGIPEYFYVINNKEEHTKEQIAKALKKIEEEL